MSCFRMLAVAGSLATCLAARAQAPDPAEWQNPQLTQQGQEVPRVTFQLAGAAGAAPWQQSLNGTWKFHYVDRPAERPLDFFQPGFSDASWKTIQVPGNWEIQGFGIPIYTNITYPFPKNQPFIDPKYNPVGTYRRSFTVPADWAGKQVLLHFGAISGCAFVYVNGQRVGISKAAKSPAEFDVTKYLKPGDNQLAVQVMRWHDGSYLEDQDFWRLSGLDRNTAALLGVYQDSVRRAFPDTYIRPQEYGYHTDARWLTLTDSLGRGLRVEAAGQPLCFSALPYRSEDLDPGLSKKQQHPTDLKPHGQTFVHLDLAQRGVGGDNSWGALPHEQYRLLAKQYSYSYVLRVLDGPEAASAPASVGTSSVRKLPAASPRTRE